MANGDVQDNVSDQYLEQFDRPIGVSGMQKLQEFPMLQQLGYNGQLSSMKNDFHGLQDFKDQMSKYSSVSHTLKIGFTIIQAIIPNNPSIGRLLITSPGMGTVGKLFSTIQGFGQVFALTPSDLASPSSVSAKASVSSGQSTQTSITTTSANIVGGSFGGAGVSGPVNASQLQGIQIIGLPDDEHTMLAFDGTHLVWVAP